MSGYEVVVFDVDGYTYVQSFPTKIAAVMRERLNLDVADHERKAKAAALREAADAFEGGHLNLDCAGPDIDRWRLMNEVRGNQVDSLRARAEAIESEEA